MIVRRLSMGDLRELAAAFGRGEREDASPGTWRPRNFIPTQPSPSAMVPLPPILVTPLGFSPLPDLGLGISSAIGKATDQINVAQSTAQMNAPITPPPIIVPPDAIPRQPVDPVYIAPSDWKDPPDPPASLDFPRTKPITQPSTGLSTLGPVAAGAAGGLLAAGPIGAAIGAGAGWAVSKVMAKPDSGGLSTAITKGLNPLKVNGFGGYGALGALIPDGAGLGLVAALVGGYVIGMVLVKAMRKSRS